MISIKQSKSEKSIIEVFKNSPEILKVHTDFADVVSKTLSGIFETKIEFILRSTEFSSMSVIRDRFLPKNASTHLFNMPPLFGQGIIQLDSHLALRFIDLSFNGNGVLDVNTGDNNSVREHSTIEKQILKQVITKVLLDLKSAWAEIMKGGFAYDDINNGNLYFEYLPKNFTVRIIKFDVKIAHSYLSFNLYYPVIPKTEDFSLFISNEHPQVIAWFLGLLLDKKLATKTLKNLIEPLSADVIYRLATMSSSHRQPVDGVLKILSNELGQPVTLPKGSAFNGLKKAKEILTGLPIDLRKNIIEKITSFDFKLGETLKTNEK